MEWYFDRETVKLLRYIYKHKGVKENKIIKKFKDEDVSLMLANLSADLYLIARDKEGKLFTYENCKVIDSASNPQWYTTPKSNLIVQNDEVSLWRWLIPLIFSAISLLLSGTNFVINILK